jgi:hypothetical protein
MADQAADIALFAVMIMMVFTTLLIYGGRLCSGKKALAQTPAMANIYKCYTSNIQTATTNISCNSSLTAVLSPFRQQIRCSSRRAFLN